MTLPRLLIVLAFLLPAGCESTIYLPGPDLPRPQGGFIQAMLWRPVTGATRKRMVLVGAEDPAAQSGETTIYRTQWTSPRTGGETWLVCLQDPGGGLGAFTQWQLYVYDADLKMVRFGTVSFVDAHPLGIVEVKPRGSHLPVGRNGEWQLAVIACRSGSDDVSLHGEHLWSSSYGVTAELIRWDDDWHELPYGSGNLNPRVIDHIAYRQAELGLTVWPEGRLVFDGQPLPKPERWLDIEAE